MGTLCHPIRPTLLSLTNMLHLLWAKENVGLPLRIEREIDTLTRGLELNVDVLSKLLYLPCSLPAATQSDCQRDCRFFSLGLSGSS